MIKFLCWLDWTKGCPDEHYFGVCLWGFSRVRSMLELVDPVWEGIIHSFEGLTRTKRQRKKEFVSFCFLPTCLSCNINLLLPLVWDLHLLFPSSQVFGLGLELHHWPFPSLLFANGRLCDFSACIIAWADSSW